MKSGKSHFLEKNKNFELIGKIYTSVLWFFLIFTVFVSSFLLLYFKEFFLGSLFLSSIVFLALCLILLKKGYVFSSVFLLTSVFSVFFLVGEILILRHNSRLIFYLAGRFGTLVTIFVPLITFGLKNKKYLVFSTILPLFLFLTFDFWVKIFTLQKHLQFEFNHEQNWLINLGFILLLVLNYILIFTLQKTNFEYEEKLLAQKKKIEEINKKLQASINCAERIQKALFKGESILLKNFPGYFILYLPKEVVSGDFYWGKVKNDKIYIVLGDCTGHGVPGAFLTLLSISLLNTIDLNTVPTPADILEFLRIEFKKLFDNNDLKFGLDASVILVDKKEQKIVFAAAHHTIVLVSKNKKISKFRGVPNTVGMNITEIPFINTEIRYETGDIIYLFSDGYADQFNESRQKIGNLKFRQLLENFSVLSLEQQKEKLQEFFFKWKGNFQQIDDVLVIGIKL